MATTPALLTLAVPESRRGFSLGLMSTTTEIGPIGGQSELEQAVADSGMNRKVVNRLSMGL